MPRAALAIVTALFLAQARAAPPPERVTFNRDIAPILFAHCAPCHRPGEAAPFSLLTYGSARAHARQIKEVTARRYMPPWLPEPGPPHFLDEDVRRLSEAQIERIGRWAEQGAPEGDPADLPPPPTFPDGWQLGEPDLVVKMAEPFVLQPGGTDVFRHFVLSPNLDRVRYVRGIEVRPGNKTVAHHGVLMVDPTFASRQRDAEDPLSGFDGMVPTREALIPDGHLVGWLPGATPRFEEPGMAWRLQPGADLLLQLHMLPSGKPEEIQPEIGLFFTDEPPTRFPVVIVLGSKTMDIPAGRADYAIRDRYTLPVDVQVQTIYPHAHFLGKDMQCHATRPDGTRVRLIHIKDWDFNWQDQYRYVEPISLPRGSVIDMQFTYDNTASNPRNPHDPPRRVTYGPRSTDEMGYLSIQLLPRDLQDRALLARDFALKELNAWVASYTMMIELHPDDPDPRTELAYSYIQLGRNDEAVAQLERVLKLDPERADALYYLGTLLGLRGDAAGAAAHLERALAADPKLVEAMTNLAALSWRAGDLRKSETWYRRALSVRPDLIEANLNLGRMLFGRGDYAQCIPLYEVVLRQTPDDALTRYQMSLALSVTGRATEAAEQGRRALQSAVATGNEDLAREIRRRLEAQGRGVPYHAGSTAR